MKHRTLGITIVALLGLCIFERGTAAAFDATIRPALLTHAADSPAASAEQPSSPSTSPPTHVSTVAQRRYGAYYAPSHGGPSRGSRYYHPSYAPYYAPYYAYRPWYLANPYYGYGYGFYGCGYGYNPYYYGGPYFYGGLYAPYWGAYYGYPGFYRPGYCANYGGCYHW